MPPPDKPGVFYWLGSTVRNLIDRAAEERVESYVTRIEAEVNRLKEAWYAPHGGYLALTSLENLFPHGRE